MKCFVIGLTSGQAVTVFTSKDLVAAGTKGAPLYGGHFCIDPGDYVSIIEVTGNTHNERQWRRDNPNFFKPPLQGEAQ